MISGIWKKLRQDKELGRGILKRGVGIQNIFILWLIRGSGKVQFTALRGHVGTVESTKVIIGVDIEYYRELFKYEPRPDLKIVEDFFKEADKMTVDENEALEIEFLRKMLERLFLSHILMGHQGQISSLSCSTNTFRK
jgi:hypothetical protein